MNDIYIKKDIINGTWVLHWTDRDGSSRKTDYVHYCNARAALFDRRGRASAGAYRTPYAVDPDLIRAVEQAINRRHQLTVEEVAESFTSAANSAIYRLGRVDHENE